MSKNTLKNIFKGLLRGGWGLSDMELWGFSYVVLSVRGSYLLGRSYLPDSTVYWPYRNWPCLRKRFSLEGILLRFVVFCILLSLRKLICSSENMFVWTFFVIKYRNIFHSLLGRSGRLQEMFFEPEVRGMCNIRGECRERGEKKRCVIALLTVTSGAQTVLARCGEPPNGIETEVEPCKGLEKEFVCRKG